jgi:integrase
VAREAWLVDFKDAAGKRRYKQFDRKKDADAWLVRARNDVAAGTFTADAASITVAAAADQWLERCDANGLERSTLTQYRSHARHHITPHLGKVKLSRLTRPQVEAWLDYLVRHGRTRELARRALRSLKSIIGEAQRLGQVAQNVARDVKVAMPRRHQVKVTIPTKAEVKALLDSAADRQRALLTAAVFTGMRASELRGLRWQDVNFRDQVVHVRQRADTSGGLGSPKSASARRDIPMAPALVTALKEWRLACGPKRGTHDLVFPGRFGRPLSHNTCRDELGRLHRFRHFFASWLIDQGFGPKRVQALMGHASISVTLDIYSHLWPQENDHARFAAAERALLG